MPSNTNASDVNELACGFILAGEKWFDSQAKSQFQRKSKLIGAQETTIQYERAKAMVLEFLSWAKQRKYIGRPSKVWWTARPGDLGRAVGQPVDSSKNPTDILVKFGTGPAKGFLGLSAKSTHGSSDIGFKNPGVGTVEAELNLDLNSILADTIARLTKKLKLPETNVERKSYIRAHPKIQQQTQAAGSTVLAKIRNVMLLKLKRMQQPKLRDYLLHSWMNAAGGVYPPYVKVTGFGDLKNRAFRAKVEDPLENDKLSAIMRGPIRLEPVGNEAIGVTAAGKRIMKMRAKFESEKLASVLKFSGDPW